MAEETTTEKAQYCCQGFAERPLKIHVEAPVDEYDTAEEAARLRAEEALSDLGIDPEFVSIDFDEIQMEEA